MKRLIILCTVVASFFCALTTNASDFGAITSNSKIADSLECLKSIGATDVLAVLNGNNPDKQPIRVSFRELEVYGMANCEAVTVRNKAGNVVIYINKKHENAPSEAIACLIAHESQHNQLTGTRQEEVKAWLKEVSTWNAFTRRDKTLALSGDKLVKRENYISKLYNNDPIAGAQAVEKVVASHPTYAGLN